MKLVGQYLRDLVSEASAGWNRFWFTPSDPATLCVIRVLTGAMLFYTHTIWALNSDAFFGPTSWLSRDVVDRLQGDGFAWSYLWIFESRSMLGLAHIAGLIVFAMLTVGLFTRVVSVLAFLITVAYANRVPGALFGLDQINALLAMYLMVGPSGARYSLDRFLENDQSGQKQPAVRPAVSANIAVRLMQLHLCVVYLFAGLSKLQGPAWWNGTAIWGGIANLEYQSLDMTWLVHWPLVINFLTHLTVAWEIAFCVLIWNRLARPIVLFLAIPIHLGIACCMGMMTFGLVMLIANVSFVSPYLIRGLIGVGDQDEFAGDSTCDDQSVSAHPHFAAQRIQARQSADHPAGQVGSASAHRENRQVERAAKSVQRRRRVQ